MEWTQEEIDYLTEHYPKHGSMRKCAAKLCCSCDTVRNLARSLGIIPDTIQPEHKICSRCQQEKPKNNFYSNICKSCKQQSQYHSRKRRLKTDPAFKIRLNLANRINAAIRDNIKSTDTISLLGCSAEDARAYLESKFQPGMSWANYGLYGWHIDHIRPCASFDLSKSEEQRKCFHFTNLQPLWAKENLSKNDALNWNH